MSAAFAALLTPLYAKLGVAAQFTPAGGSGTASPRQVIFDSAGADVLGLLTQEPTLRAIAAEYPQGIPRDSVFRVAEADYVVRSSSPLAPDAAELRVELARMG